LRIVLLAIGVAFFVGWWMVRRSLPKTHGVTAIAGLKAPVSVDRDRWGVPYIQAQSLGDLAMAQGYTTAQDRLWQMDTLRRAAAGELSEIFGPVPAVEALDRENRRLGMRAAAEDAAQHMDAETRLITEAYAAGVNRCIEEQRGKLPLEFTLLGYEPRPWTPVDTFLISAFMWKTLTTTWRAKINRAKLTDIVGPDRARDLFVTDSPLDHFIVGGEAAAGAAHGCAGIAAAHPQTTESNYRADFAARSARPFPRANGEAPIGMWERAMWENASEILRAFDDETAHISGSNNFVVSGAHTATGKPLLANDTHLGLDVPDIWYTVHLKAPEWNVEGFALPGVPLVIIGHNQRIAWGFTNSNADVQDVYQEKFDAQDPTRYLDHGKWVKAQVRPEVIHVKGEADQTENVVVTRHGPIVARDPDEQRGYALRWTLTEPGGMDFGYPMLGHAQNWNEFLDVMRSGAWAGPEHGVRGCGWKYRMDHGGANSDTREGDRRSSGAWGWRRLRLEGLYPV
jgi:penicillin amidase